MLMKMMKTRPDAVVPRYMTAGALGLDLTAASMTYGTDGYIEYDTGLAIEFPRDHAVMVLPRSSVSKRGMWLCNGPGLIDADYRGSIKLRFYYEKGESKFDPYLPGERIGQLLCVPVVHPSIMEVDGLSESVRGGEGFGSTSDTH